MLADLHIHTTASDGNWNPRLLTEEVRKAGIGLFAVTDHDTAANIKLAEQYAKSAGLKYLPGVEICSTLYKQSFHILGYGVRPESVELKELLAHNTELMEETDRESIRKLIDAGYKLDYEEYLAYKHNAERGGWKSLSFLIDKGLCADINEFFSKLFTKEVGIDFPEFPPPREAISAIKAAGGIPVLAHPGSGFHGSSLEETLDCFAREDIEGVECYHPCHDGETTRRAVDWCNKRGMIITGGSDCHGSFFADRCLGRPEIYLDQLRLGDLADLIR